MRKTIVATIPKSGTYLSREILVNAGLRCDPRHLQQKDTEPHSIQGDFRVGHPGCYLHCPHKVVFFHRDLREVYISSLAFKMKLGQLEKKPINTAYIINSLRQRNRPGIPVRKMERLIGWLKEADLVLSFWNLFNERKVKEFVEFVTEQPCYDARRLIDVSTNRKTKTWTGKQHRTSWEEHWTPELDATWKDCDLYPYNVELGYEQD